MGTTADKLLYLQDTKSAIKDAIVAKGVSVPIGTTFRDYADKIGDITTGGGGSIPTADAWVRPAEWLALPDNVDGVQKVSILNAVFDTDSEFVALNCQGAYTVDWGDGVIENFATGIKAEHKYYYSDTNLNSDTVSKFGYKQCIITITPFDGDNLISINFNQSHNTIGSSALYDIASGFLDIRLNSSYCTNLTIGASTDYVKHAMLEQCLIGELANTTLSYLFNNCYLLQSVSFKDTSNVTDWTYAFLNCYSLQKMPNITFKDNANCNRMFFYCYSLVEVPDLVLNSNSMDYMFSYCRSLTRIKLTYTNNSNYSLANLFTFSTALNDIDLTLLGTGKITSLSSTFYGTVIKTAPTLDTSACISFYDTFYNCSRLVSVPQYDYSSAIDLTSMFQNCSSLKSVPNFNTTSSLTSLSNIFTSCVSLERGATFDSTVNVTTVVAMYTGCISLVSVPTYSFPDIKMSNLGGLFNGCNSLQIVPAITFNNAITSATNVITNAYSLKRMLMPLKYSFTVAYAKMSATALNEMYSILPTVSGQTVIVTGNYGTASDNPAIATAKGWTVIG